MTQPSFVPIAEADQVRRALSLEVPRRWALGRPGDVRTPQRVSRQGTGSPGPDQGYALRLARHAEDRLVLQPGERADDVVVGCALLAARRASSMGRAPSIYDINHAMAVWGFDTDAADLPQTLIEERKAAFQSAAHDYAVQRALVDRVPEETLQLSEEELATQRADWQRLLGS